MQEKRLSDWQLAGQRNILCLLLILGVFLIGMIPAAASLIKEGWFFYQENSREEHALYLSLPAEIWEPGSGWSQPKLLPLNADRHVVWLSTVLQTGNKERDTLMIMTTNQAVRVWLDERMIYEKGSFVSGEYDEGAYLHLIKLPGFTGEGRLLVEFYGQSTRHLGQVHFMQLDSVSNHIKNLFLYDAPIAAAFPIPLVIILIMLLYRCYYPGAWKRLYDYTILFMAVFAVWLLSASYFKFFLLDAQAFWWYLLIVMAYLLPISSNLILYELLRDKPYAHMKLILGANLVLFAAAVSGELFGFHTLNRLMKFYYPMILVGDGAAFWWSFRAAWQGDKFCRAVMVPTAAFTVLGVFDGIAGYFHLLPWRMYFTPLAVYAFAFFVTAILREQLRREHRLAAKNAGLEQAVAAAKLRSETDPLTGCWNRVKLRKLMAELMAKENEKKSFALLMLDVDHFKKINDSFGHDTGDAVLLNFSRIIRENLGKNMHFVRWGGEEFMVLVEQADKKRALRLAEKFRQLVSANKTDGKAITCSIGVAVWLGSKDTPGALFKRVDNALYQAKRNGRNQVCLAADDMTDK